jgi:hypothetical protein
MKKSVTIIIMVFAFMVNLVAQPFSEISRIDRTVAFVLNHGHSSSPGDHLMIIDDLRMLYKLDPPAMANFNSSDTYLLDSLFWHLWNEETQLWEKVSRSAYTYNEFAEETSFTHQLWNDPGMQWENIFRRLQTYMKDDLSKEAISQEWTVEKSNWQNTYKTHQTFSTDGHLIEQTGQVLSRENYDWVNHEQSAYTYNDAWQLTDITEKVWNVDYAHWESAVKKHKIFNDQGYELEVTVQTWDANELLWVNSTLTSKHYTEESLLTEIVNSEWNTEDALWHEVYRTIFQHNSEGVPIAVTDQYRGEAGQWVNEFRHLNAYDVFENLIGQDAQRWDASHNRWENTYRHMYAYDEDNNWISSVTQEWDEAVSEFRNQSSYNLYYSIHEAESVKEINTEGTLCYPNPCSSYATIDFTTNNSDNVRITLSGVDGKPVQLIADELMSAGQQKIVIDVSNLPTGIYFYKIESSEVARTGKLMVTR